jgi:hypothetical protein
VELLQLSLEERMAISLCVLEVGTAKRRAGRVLSAEKRMTLVVRILQGGMPETMEPLQLSTEERTALAACVIDWVKRNPESAYLESAAPLRMGYAKLRASITQAQDEPPVENDPVEVETP